MKGSMLPVVFFILVIVRCKDVDNTSPIIKLTLEPPINPFPKITEAVADAERSRSDQDKDGMKKIEKEYNRQLEDAKKQIKKVLPQLLNVLTDKNMLQKVVDASTKMVATSSEISPHASGIQPPAVSTVKPVSFFHVGSELGVVQEHSLRGTIVDKPAISFLQIKGIGGASSSLGNLVPGTLPSFQVELSQSDADSIAGDSKIKSKIKEITSKRASLTGESWTAAAKYFEQLKEVFIDSLKTAIEIELTAYTTDLASIKNSLSKTSSSLSFLSTNPLPLSFISIPDSGTIQVAVASPDKKYPTVADYVNSLERRRNSTERLYKIKILQLVRQMSDVLIDLTKTELNSYISRSITLLGHTSEAIVQI